MTCEEVRRHFVALQDGEASAALPERVAEHIETCSACRIARAEFAAVARAAAAWKAKGGDVWEVVRQEIAADPARERVAVWSDTVFCRLLLDQGLITESDLEFARSVQRRVSGDLGRLLVRLEFLTEADRVRVRAAAEGVPFIDLTRHAPETSALARVPASVARRYRALPLKWDRLGATATLWVAVADAHDTDLAHSLRTACGCRVVLMAAVPNALDDAVDQAYGREDALPAGREEIRALREEMAALRAEMAEMRREIAARTAPRPTGSRLLFPYVLPDDAPHNIM